VGEGALSVVLFGFSFGVLPPLGSLRSPISPGFAKGEVGIVGTVSGTPTVTLT
jgi:hypothetical protein